MKPKKYLVRFAGALGYQELKAKGITKAITVATKKVNKIYAKEIREKILDRVTEDDVIRVEIR